MSASGPESIGYESWSSLLYKVNAICSPAELHGLACGLIASGQSTVDKWISVASDFMDLQSALSEDVVSLDEEQIVAFEQFYQMSFAALDSEELNFRLLLPDDELPIASRVQALADWAASFLHGIGEISNVSAEKLDQESRDLLSDFASISKASIEVDDNEESEAYYSEVVEYVRLGVYSLFYSWNTADSRNTADSENTPG